MRLVGSWFSKQYLLLFLFFFKSNPLVPVKREFIPIFTSLVVNEAEKVPNSSGVLVFGCTRALHLYSRPFLETYRVDIPGVNGLVKIHMFDVSFKMADNSRYTLGTPLWGKVSSVIKTTGTVELVQKVTVVRCASPTKCMGQTNGSVIIKCEWNATNSCNLNVSSSKRMQLERFFSYWFGRVLVWQVCWN